MKTLLKFLVLCFSITSFSQVNYGTPPQDLIPEKLKGIEVAITVKHFPEENDPVKIDNLYYWKHATAIHSKQSEIKIEEFGAYIYYNNQWNLRKIYDLKELDKTFGTSNQVMLQGQPYVCAENWRVGDQLFGGWALWYFIGTTPDGTQVCGYGRINTTDNLLN